MASLPRANLDVCGLWGDDDAFPFIEASLIDGFQFLSEVLLHAFEHSLRCNCVCVLDEKGEYHIVLPL